MQIKHKTEKHLAVGAAVCQNVSLSPPFAQTALLANVDSNESLLLASATPSKLEPHWYSSWYPIAIQCHGDPAAFGSAEIAPSHSS